MAALQIYSAEVRELVGGSVVRRLVARTIFCQTATHRAFLPEVSLAESGLGAQLCGRGSRKPKNAVAKLSVWALRYLRLESKLPSRARVRARRDDGSDFEGSVSDYVIDDAWAAVEAGHPVDVRPSAALFAHPMRLTNCRSRVGGASRDVGCRKHEHLPRSGAGDCSFGFHMWSATFDWTPEFSDDELASWENHSQESRNWWGASWPWQRSCAPCTTDGGDHSFEAAELKLS